MELAASVRPSQSGSLTLAAIAHVFTLKYVAEKLGEDEQWLRDLQINMDPEEGCMWIYGVGEDGVPGFTASGIECLQDIIAVERAAGRAPPKVGPPK